MMSAGPTDLIVLLIRRWRTMVFLGVIGLGGAIAYGLLAPKWYASMLTVVPSQRSDSSALMSKLPSFGGLDASISSDVQRIEAVLKSVSVSDEVIAKFGLKERYGTTHMEHARKELWQHCSTSVDKRSGVVALICEDKEPETAMAITAFFGEVGNRVSRRVSVSSAYEERRFLESQVVKSRKAVDDASQKLREFQERHKVVDLPEQSKAVISAMASIKGDLLSKQLELSYLSKFSARTESNVVQLQQQIGILQAKLEQLETRVPEPTSAAGSGSNTAGFFPQAMHVPELRFELEQLFRQQKLEETLFFLMTQRYEMAKVDEARDTSNFQILDQPTLPTVHTRPKRRQIALFGLFAGLALAAAWIVVPHWWRRRMAGAPAEL